MDEPKRDYLTNEEVQTRLRFISIIPLVIGFGIAYLVWPAGITEVPLGVMTFGQLLQVAASGAIGLATIVLTAMVFWF